MATRPEMVTTTPDTEPPEKLHGRLWAVLHSFLVTTVRMWVVLIGAAVIAVLYFAVAANLKEVDRRQREADTRTALIAAYNADVRAYDNSLRAQAECLDSVARSDLNRGQHEAIVGSFEGLKVVFPESANLAAIVDSIVAGLRAGPLLSAPPRNVEDCPPTPEPPVPPVGLEVEAS